MYVGGGGRDDRAFIQSTLMGTNKTVCLSVQKLPSKCFIILLVTIAIVATRMRRKSTFTLGYGHNPPATRRPSVSRHNHQENIMQISGLCVTCV